MVKRISLKAAKELGMVEVDVFDGNYYGTITAKETGKELFFQGDAWDEMQNEICYFFTRARNSIGGDRAFVISDYF